MVTTWSRRSFFFVVTNHSPSHSVRRQSAASPSSVVTPAEFPSRPSSSASPHPPLVIEQSVGAEFYVRESLIVAGATNATVLTASVVLPHIITALAAHAGVPALSIDAIGSSDTIKVNNQVTLHYNDAYCTFGGFSIEQHALMDSLSTSHHVMHALLHRIWDRLDTYSELLLSFAGHIQPTDPPRPPRARSIYGSFVVLMDSFSFEVIYVFLWIS
ncbi:unnamed protein product [Prunus armeniaca]|uniref:Uncharacterized protein n=1 Tax=Prunus armeniaca TaxID=36596 RepID=A0A6J5WF55_PRUAR|nr:unnamed protein product [Prunus armeniaca]